MTYKQAFEKISQRLSEADKTAFDAKAVVQVTMSDEDCGGTFYIQYANGDLTVEPYDYWDNDAAIDVKRLDFVKILEGKLSVQNAVESGKIQIFGSTAAVSALEGIIKPVKRAASAKKNEKVEAPKQAEKKAAAVKTEAPKKTVKKTAAVKAEAPAVKKEAPKAAATEKVTEKKAVTAVKKTTKAAAAPKKATKTGK